MKYPMEYWTGRMSGVLMAISKLDSTSETTKKVCVELVNGFEEDYEEDYDEDEVRDNDLHNSGYEGDDDMFCACGNELKCGEDEFCSECV